MLVFAGCDCVCLCKAVPWRGLPETAGDSTSAAGTTVGYLLPQPECVPVEARTWLNAPVGRHPACALGGGQGAAVTPQAGSWGRGGLVRVAGAVVFCEVWLE